MNKSNTGFRALGGFAATAAVWGAVLALYACGQSGVNWTPDAGTPGSSGGGSSSGGGLIPGMGNPMTVCDDAGQCGVVLVFPDGSTAPIDAGSGQPQPTLTSAIGVVHAPDCAGCSFPPPNAPSCPAGAPAIKIIYPTDKVLVPPNLNVMSVQWTPFGPPFSRYEVDFSQTMGSVTTDWRVITACSTQTSDMQTGNPGTPSGGCELVIDPPSWSAIVGANRGGTPISVTVRGTTDGNCASTSMNTITMSIAEEDLLGTYYYWKSTVSTTGTGGQIWAKVFGDLNTNERDVTSTVRLQAGTLQATCNGCHALSRDGSRMVVYSDDNDSDDEYSDVGGSLLDMTTMPNATELGMGVNGARNGGQPPGFTTINPLASFYVTSNGFPCTGVGGGGGGRGGGACGTSAGYPAAVPTNGFSVWNGQTGNFFGAATIGAAGQRPTMPDWSIDGNTVVYVQPGAVAQYDMNGPFGVRNDDMHMFGGSLYTAPYSGNGVFGTPTVYLQSGGENNYYPSYSPDKPMSFIIFNRAALDMSAGSVTGCTTGNAPMCPNDSFSNPAARLMLMGASAPGTTPIDLERANGSPANGGAALSNSYPRWAPFVQSYHGNKLLWFTFSSTRDYGLRVLNHKTGMYQCYPADAYQTPGGAHGGQFAAACQQPQLWMAPLTFTEAQSATADPSGVAFWIPYQDIGTHNHTAQWTEEVPIPHPDAGTCSCGALYGACGPAAGGCPCCPGQNLVCSGNGQCINVAN
jgi:hypothetical protein